MLIIRKSSLINCRKSPPFLTVLTQISVWVFFSLDKKRIIVYNNSVVNREDYINVVTNFDMLTHAAPDEVSDSIKELLIRVVWG